jgi:hypothetical protein
MRYWAQFTVDGKDVRWWRRSFDLTNLESGVFLEDFGTVEREEKCGGILSSYCVVKEYSRSTWVKVDEF